MKLTIVFFALFLTSIDSFACNCNPGASIESSVKSCDVIAKAKILSISYSDRLDTLNVVSDGDPRNVFSKYWKFQVKIYTAQILYTYKGVLKSDTISIITGINGAACGFGMEINQQYLVYGFKKDYLGFSTVQRKATDDKLIWTSNCTRSWIFSDEEAKGVKEEIERQSYRK